MYVSEAQLLESGSDWYIETPVGSEGPVESQVEATDYLDLLNLVHAARAGTACDDYDYPVEEMISF